MPPPRKVFVLNDEQRQLVEDNILLMYKCWEDMKKKYSFMNTDDLYDCCTEAAVNAASSLDVKKGKYSTLLYVAAERNVLKLIRYWDFECRKNTMKSMSLDYFHDSDKSESFANRYLGVEDSHDWISRDEVDRLLSVLNEKERDVIYKRYVLGLSREEISKEYGGVGRWITLAKKKIRESAYEQI